MSIHLLTFIAVYRGRSVSTSELIGVSADPALVSDILARMVDQDVQLPADPILAAKPAPPAPAGPPCPSRRD